VVVCVDLEFMILKDLVTLVADIPRGKEHSPDRFLSPCWRLEHVALKRDSRTSGKSMVQNLRLISQEG